MSMSDLAAFLNARLDEDEAVAKANTGIFGLADDGTHAPAWPDYGTFNDRHTDAADSYIERFRPSRALREVAASRRIVETVSFWSENSQDALASVLRDLASAYSDHPGYGAAMAS